MAIDQLKTYLKQQGEGAVERHRINSECLRRLSNSKLEAPDLCT